MVLRKQRREPLAAISRTADEGAALRPPRILHRPRQAQTEPTGDPRFVCQLVQVEALYGGPEGRELGLSKVVAAEISNASGGPNVAPLPDEEHSDEHAYSCVVRSGSGSRSGERIGYYEAQVSEPFRALFADAVRRGNARFSLPLRFLDRDAQTATMPDGADLAEVHLLEPIGGERGLQTEAPQEEVADGARGAKTVLAVRVLAPDGSPPETADEIAAALFGIADDPDLLPTASVAAQYAALSHGQLSLLPAVGPGISNGVAEIQIDMNVRGSKIQSELSSHLLEKTAQALGASVDEVADRIVYCLPTGSLLQGRDTWTAYTYLFQHQSFFQQSRCTKLSVVVHELGHSFGFRHSGANNDDYGDESCFMGYAVNQYGVPRKAFNAHKHWLSGWFADRAIRLDAAMAFGPVGTMLASFVDYRNPDLEDGAVILVRIGNLFLQFNEGKDYNVDTPAAARDHVLVVESSGPGEVSQLVAGIAVGQTYVRSRFTAAGHDLVIEFCDHVVAPYGYAAISIHVSDGVQTSVCANSSSFGNSGGLDTDGGGQGGDASNSSPGTFVFEDGNSEKDSQRREKITIGVIWAFVGVFVLLAIYLAVRLMRQRKRKLQKTASDSPPTSKQRVRVRKCSTDEASRESLDQAEPGDTKIEL